MPQINKQTNTQTILKSSYTVLLLKNKTALLVLWIKSISLPFPHPVHKSQFPCYQVNGQPEEYQSIVNQLVSQQQRRNNRS